MFPYYVPAAIGLLGTAISINALTHSGRYARRWSWVLGLLASVLLWLPALVLFVIAPNVWPQAHNGSSDTYYQLMGWQVAWIFLGIPIGLIGCFFIFIGRPSALKG